ncbi:ABC transporter permease [Flavobacteriaceae bacterium M23B6Z8]
MYFPLYIAKRYLISKSSQNAVNIINRITFIVTIIGAASLFIVLSGFSGLKTFSLSFSNSFDPDLKVLPVQGKFIEFTKDQEQQLAQITGIESYSKELEERVFLSYKQKNHVAYLRGVDQRFLKVTGIDSLIFYGKWFEQSNEVVAGIRISNLLSLAPNDYINPLEIVVPKPGSGSFNAQSNPFNKAVVVMSGVFSITEELDKKYIFGSLPKVQQLLQKDSNTITAITLKLKDQSMEAEVIKNIKQIFGEAKVEVKNRAQMNDALYKMLNTENLAIYLIFTLVLIIALFNVAGAIIMMILDKKENLKTLFNLGATISSLKRIFFMQGILLVGIGGISGILLGMLVAWMQISFHLVKITPSLPYPMEIRFINIIIVALTIFILGILAARISSSRISKKLLSS